MVVEKRVRRELHIVQGGKKIEERIAGLRYEDFIAGIAEQAKEITVSFAGTGGEDDLRGIDCCSAVAIVGADGFTRFERTLRDRVVDKRLLRGQRGENGRFVIGESTMRGIRGGEIVDWPAGFFSFAQRAGEIGFCSFPVRARGEVHGAIFSCLSRC